MDRKYPHSVTLEKLTSRVPDTSVSKEVPIALNEASKFRETPEAVVGRAVWPKELAELGFSREGILALAGSQPGFAEEVADELASDPDFFRKHPDEFRDLVHIWGRKAGSLVEKSAEGRRDSFATAEKIANFSKDKSAESLDAKAFERLRALNRDILAALPADRKTEAEKAVSADAAKVSESLVTGKPTGDARLDELARSAREKGVRDPSAVADMATSSYLLTRRGELLASVPESARASLGARFAELESASASSGIPISGTPARMVEAFKGRDREFVQLGNTAVLWDAVRIGDRVRIADQTFELASEPPRKFIEGQGLRIETTVPYPAKFEASPRLSGLRAEAAALDAATNRRIAAAEGLSGSVLKRSVELERNDPERYRRQAETLREELRSMVEGHYRTGELGHPLDQEAAKRLLAAVSPEAVDRTADDMARRARVSAELSRIEEEEASREERFHAQCEQRDEAARGNRDYCARLGLGGLGQANFERFIEAFNDRAAVNRIRRIDLAENFSGAQRRALAASMAAFLGLPPSEFVRNGEIRAVVTCPDGNPATPAEAARRLVLRHSHGTGDLPKARLEGLTAASGRHSVENP